MARSSTSRPWRSLGILGLIILAIYGTVAAGVTWSDASWTPKLGLDLEGGVQIILKPQPIEGQQGTVTPEMLDEAVNIIRQRVDSTGVAEAEITTQGDNRIMVALPGKPTEETKNLVKESAQLQFRAVLAAAAGAPAPEPTPSPTTSGKATGTVSPSPGASATKAPAVNDGASTKATPSPTESTNNAALPKSVRQALAVPKAAATTATPTPTASAGATPAPSGAAPAPNAKPTDPSDLAWATEDVQKKFAELDCSDPANLKGGITGDPEKPMVVCEDNGSAKYILGPAEVVGTDVKTASAGIGTNSQGNSTGQWQVNLEFTGEGGKKFAKVTERLAAISQSEARNQFGIVLDGLVISAPQTNERIPTGQAQISGGNFTQKTATELASKLKFGALPLSFEVDTEDNISALLGQEQLKRGLLAGLVGLLLVVLYSLLQYRALGLVTVASLLVVGVITYGVILLLSWRQGYRLTLPGIAGLIVSIGITADSFIVYFERIRDEVRDGRQLLPATESGWTRARRTILASDTVSFLAALVLYVLAVGGVKGFAFTLGLTTLVDILVVFLFTYPMVVLLARTHFFRSGHKLSGFDAAHLGRDITYAGRGRVRPTKPAPGTETIAERRAREAAGGGTGEAAVPQDEPSKDVPASTGGKG